MAHPKVIIRLREKKESHILLYRDQIIFVPKELILLPTVHDNLGGNSFNLPNEITSPDDGTIDVSWCIVEDSGGRNVLLPIKKDVG